MPDNKIVFTSLYVNSLCPICLDEDNNNRKKIGHLFVSAENAEIIHAHCQECFLDYALINKQARCQFCFNPVDLSKNQAYWMYSLVAELNKAANYIAVASTITSIYLNIKHLWTSLEKVPQLPEILKIGLQYNSIPSVCMVTVAKALFFVDLTEKIISTVMPDNNWKVLNKNTVKVGGLVFLETLAASILYGKQEASEIAFAACAAGVGEVSIRYISHMLTSRN